MQSKIKSAFILVLFFSCISLFAQERATPRNGEGIYGFLRRHNCSEKDYQSFLELNKGKFGKNNSLILGVHYTLPSKDNSTTKEQPKKSTAETGKKRKEPLFGKKYEDYTIKSNTLKGACFFLVSGHGGPDSGAIARVDGKELHEDEYAYDIMLRLARNLLQEGATVHIIIQDAKDGIRDDKYLANSKRETCMGETIPLNNVKRLQQRCDKINSLSKSAKEEYQRAVFIHLDSQGGNKQLDVYFYYQNKNRASQQFATTVRNTIESQYKRHQPDRGFTGTVSTRDLYVLNNTNTTSIFAELANMQNTFDQRRYLSVNNRQALANWLLRGLINDYENSKKK